MAERFLTMATRLGTGLVIAGVVIPNIMYNVDAGERAVIFDLFRGVLPQATSEGTHFKIPFIQTPNIIDVRSRPRVISSTTGTKDLQMVNISLRVLSRPKEEYLPKIFQQLGLDFDDRVLPSLGNEVLKSVVAQFEAHELLTKRETVSKLIGSTLQKRADEFNLILDDVSITHLTFGKEFTKAVEAKQVAFQDAERQQYLVEQAEQEKLAAVIRAEGESVAAELISKAIAENGTGLIEVRRIDAAKQIATTLSSSRNVTYLPGGNNSNLLLGINPH